MEVENSPTLEFAETIEIKCIDPEDQISVDSYFFASFQDPKRAMSCIQRILDARHSSELPARPGSPAYMAHSDRSIEQNEVAPHGLKKIGAVLKPLMSRSSDKDSDTEEHKSSGFHIPFLHKHKPSHDSTETLRVDQDHSGSIAEEGQEGEDFDGYPPKQRGAAPHGHDEHKSGWNRWMKKPSKIFGSSSPSQSQTTLPTKSPSKTPGFVVRSSANDSASTLSPVTTRTGQRKRESVSEIVEPVVVDSDSDATDDEDRREGTMSHRYGSDSEDDNGRSEYNMMERSESNQLDDNETARKFRAVFALSEKEELIDRKLHCPTVHCRIEIDVRFPRVAVSCVTCLWAILCLHQLLLFPLLANPL